MPQSTVTAKATAGNAVAHGEAALITTEALATAAGAAYSLTVGNEQIAPDSIVIPVISNGTNTQGDPSLATVTVSLGKAVIGIINRHASQALNGTLKIALLVR
jgi:hypothetical protein